MLRYLVIRVVSSVAVFLVIAIGLFSLVRLAPGDPADMLVPPDAGGSDREALVHAATVRLGLNLPLPLQFEHWFAGLTTGNLGYSFATGQPVGQLLADRLGPTLLLMGTALLVGLIIAVPAGVFAAVKRNTAADVAISMTSVVAIAVPSFFLAMIAMYVFALKLRVLPSAGMHTSGVNTIGDLITHMVMPCGLLALAVAATFTRYVRSGMLEELGKDYVRTVVAKGASPVRVLGHALRNSLIPLITVLALFIPVYLSGAVVIEQVFSWPGMGQLAITALTNRDYPVIIGFGLYVAVLVLACNLIADLLYSVADPRVRVAR
jgi:peptide/nickel transport system permease protein